MGRGAAQRDVLCEEDQERQEDPLSKLQQGCPANLGDWPRCSVKEDGQETKLQDWDKFQAGHGASKVTKQL